MNDMLLELNFDVVIDMLCYLMSQGRVENVLFHPSASEVGVLVIFINSGFVQLLFVLCMNVFPCHITHDYEKCGL